jgi:ankyrin repeat protein
MGNEMQFLDALKGLRHGDFSRLEPLFIGGNDSPIVQWSEQGLFEDHPAELAEALSCASFLGHTEVAEYLLKRGIEPAGGSATGSNALHWASDRGQLEAVRLLLHWKAPTETLNRFGGTALGQAMWSFFNAPRPAHIEIIKELLKAGARVDAVECPTGNAEIDALLKRYGAGKSA